MANTAEIHTKMLDAWNRRDWKAMRALLHPDYTYTGPDGVEQTGADAGLQVAQTYANAFPDGKTVIKNVHSIGNTAIAEFVATGTHKGELFGVAPTGKPVQIRVCNVLELRDGKAYREREYMDLMTLMTQIGAATRPLEEARTA